MLETPTRPRPRSPRTPPAQPARAAEAGSLLSPPHRARSAPRSSKRRVLAHVAVDDDEEEDEGGNNDQQGAHVAPASGRRRVDSVASPPPPIPLPPSRMAKRMSRAQLEQQMALRGQQRQTLQAREAKAPTLASEYRALLDQFKILDRQIWASRVLDNRKFATLANRCVCLCRFRWR